MVEKGGEVTMCEVLERVEAKWRAEGRFTMLIELVSDGAITIQKVAETADMDEPAFRKNERTVKMP